VIRRTATVRDGIGSRRRRVDEGSGTEARAPLTVRALAW